MNTTLCAACHTPLNGKLYFCHPCFTRLPTDERLSLYAMHHRGNNTTSKVAKLVRILTNEKQTTKSAG